MVSELSHVDEHGNARMVDVGDKPDSIREAIARGVVVAACAADMKVSLVVGITPDLTEHVHAGELAKAVAAMVDGSGGGRADMGQAGGKSPEKLPGALAQVPTLVEKQLKAGKA